MVKLNFKFVKNYIESEGYTLLSDNYTGAHQKLYIKCPEGHLYFVRWGDFQRGHRCKECVLESRKLDFSVIEKAFAAANYKLLSTKKDYKNAHQKLEYICTNNHRGSISWHDFQRGIRCPYCSGNAKLTIDFVRSEFEKEDYQLLSKTYINSNTKLEYICPNNHRGKICWSHFQQGKRCRKCYFIKRRNPNLTDEDRENRRKYPAYYEWRKAVFQRDDFNCKICGKRSNLVAHHFESYTDNKELRTTLSNGITLCKNCHNNFHHQFGRCDNKKLQFEEFKNECKIRFSQTRQNNKI